MTVEKDLNALRSYLSQAPADGDQAVCLRLPEGEAVPWDPARAEAEGKRLAKALDKACKKARFAPPQSLRRQVELSGALELQKSLLELTAPVSFPRLPINELLGGLSFPDTDLTRHEAFVREMQEADIANLAALGGGYVHVARDPLPALSWAVGWEDPMLIAANLAKDSEPLWLVYHPFMWDKGVPAAMPLALDFETVLACHLTGLYQLLAMGEVSFEKLAGRLARGRDDRFDSLLEGTLTQVAQASEACRKRTDVRVPNVRRQRESAVVANLLSVRGAELFKENPDCDGWLDVAFVGAYLTGPAKTAAIMKAVSKLKAPKRPTEIMQAVVSQTTGGSHGEARPCFTKGTVEQVANDLRSKGFPVITPDEYGDFENYSSLADGAAHVLSRIERLRSVL